MKRNGTSYLIISLILFSIFTLFVIFYFSQTSNNYQVDITTDNPTQSMRPLPSQQPIPLHSETHDYKSIERLHEEKPWIKLTSIVGDNFITRYDYEAEAIEIVIYTHQGAIKFSEDDIKNIRSTVESTLIQRGINLNSVKITARVE
jgi:hypothetical protein